jgi:hypothetical protein
MRFIGLVFLAALAGCTGGHRQITGNEVGGTMPWHLTNERRAFQAADAHCRKYGRAARLTQIVPEAGGTVSFDCVKP